MGALPSHLVTKPFLEEVDPYLDLTLDDIRAAYRRFTALGTSYVLTREMFQMVFKIEDKQDAADQYFIFDPERHGTISAVDVFSALGLVCFSGFSEKIECS
eukprot:TRINITY_DN46739_c0_g1_i1.p1 TRINITY_DN46739_c0_g1~~TRINITY_DN46739_c0_g1_i1.p1  ORF type:complete len:101 (-),score=6.70 TRINITY_DN46739_c0_g1_i1:48-350(-)